MSATATLEGDLDFARVARLLDGADALIADGTLDLSGVQRTDSAGLALLLELSRRARARGIELKLRGANEQVAGLARFFRLEQVLRFDESA